MKPARKRQLVDHARATWQVSIRRACRALPVDRSTYHYHYHYHYRSRRAGQAQLAERMGERMKTLFWSRDLAIREANCLADAIRCHGECAEVIVEGADPIICSRGSRDRARLA